jgi:hypothetical protein
MTAETETGHPSLNSRWSMMMIYLLIYLVNNAFAVPQTIKHTMKRQGYSQTQVFRLDRYALVLSNNLHNSHVFVLKAQMLEKKL